MRRIALGSDELEPDFPFVLLGATDHVKVVLPDETTGELHVREPLRRRQLGEQVPDEVLVLAPHDRRRTLGAAARRHEWPQQHGMIVMRERASRPALLGSTDASRPQLLSRQRAHQTFPAPGV